jgi:cytochrome P450
VYAIIRERRENPRDTGDLLSMLLAARDDEGGGMTDQQLRDETMTFFFAGHETTALALTWALHLLMEHPECERRLLEEADSQLGDREATAEDVSRLPYASQVLKETMRLFPPVWGLSREALVDCEVGGHEIPKGTQLMLSQWVTHRDPRFWDEPEAFRPDRWQDDLEKRLPRIVYFPFGSGPRMCIGYTFALMEAVLILTSLIRHHRFAPAPGQRVEPWATMTIRPKEGLRAVITRRTR